MAEEAFFCPRLLFITSRTADAGVVLTFFDGVEQGRGLQSVAARLRSGLFPHTSRINGRLHAAHNELHAEALGQSVTKLDGLGEVVARVDVHELHGDAGRGKGLGRQMGHHDAVFSAAEQDGRPLKLGRHFPQHKHGLRLEFVQMV